MDRYSTGLQGVRNIHPRAYARGVLWYGVNWVGQARARILCLWLSLIFFLTPPLMWTVVSPVLANGDHSEESPRGAQHSFNPIAFALVSGGLVVVGYLMYRIFSGKGKKNGNGEEES